MKFRVQHTFKGISLEDYEKLYFDEDFNIKLCEAVKLHRDLENLATDDKHISRSVKVGLDREIPAPVAKVLKSNRIEYTEHIEYDWGTYNGNWHTVPSLLPDKVTTKGTFSFASRGDTVVRTVEGEVKVKVFGVGGLIEKFVISDIEESYDKAAKFTQRYIDSEGKA